MMHVVDKKILYVNKGGCQQALRYTHRQPGQRFSVYDVQIQVELRYISRVCSEFHGKHGALNTLQ